MGGKANSNVDKLTSMKLAKHTSAIIGLKIAVLPMLERCRSIECALIWFDKINKSVFKNSFL